MHIPNLLRGKVVLPLVGSLALAAVLRLWGLFVGSPAQHPDEIFLVIYPLNFLSGDLNPHDFQKPSLLYYLLSVVYLGRFAITVLLGSQWDLSQYATYHYFWDNESLLLWARLLCVAFAIGTVWCVWQLARRIYGENAGIISGLLLAVSVLHVRQSALAAVDAPMTFWFVCAVWAAVRLCNHVDVRDYVLAGALVGLAGGTKYPGAAAGLAVVAAHLLGGRRFGDRTLWISGAVAVVVFVVSTPYAVFDFDTFRTHFVFQTQHAQIGRGEGVPAWLYHLWVSLRHNIGVLGLAALPAALVLQIYKHRKMEVWVVLCGFVAFLIAVGWGRLAFMRYALPLATLQVVLVSGLLAAIPAKQWRLLLVVLIAVEPLYGALRVAQLAGSTDTRTEAATWIEANIPPGTNCCNFGGWAGDPAVRTFAHHWWRMKTYARSFGEDRLYSQIEFLNREKPQRPFFAFAVHPGIREVTAGDLNTIKNAGCAYVITHRHPLSYSTVDTTFHAQLPDYGKVVARWSPVGLDEADPEFDPADAYYIPVGSFGALRQTGPQIEVWDVEHFPASPTETQTGNTIFAKGYALWASLKQDEERLEEAWELLSRASSLDSNHVDVLMVNAMLLRKEHRHREALDICQKIAAQRPNSYEVYEAMGVILDEIGAHKRAISAFRKSLQLNPERPVLYSNLAVAHRALGDHQEAMSLWRRAIDLDPECSIAHYYLGTAYYVSGDFPQALPYLERAIELRPDDIQAHNNAGSAARAAGQYRKAIQIWGKASKLDSQCVDLYYNIALTLQRDLRDVVGAVPFWRRVLDSNPEDLDALRHIAAAYAQIGEPEQEDYWRSRIRALDAEK